MKKKILLVLVSVVFFSNIALTLTLADLNIDEKILVEEVVLAEDTEITPATFVACEGIDYVIIYKGSGYIIVKIGTKYVIVPVDE